MPTSGPTATARDAEAEATTATGTPTVQAGAESTGAAGGRGPEPEGHAAAEPEGHAAAEPDADVVVRGDSPGLAGPPLAAFEHASLPRTKMALIMAVDEALRTGELASLGRYWLDAAGVQRACPQLTPSKLVERRADAEDSRQRAAADLAECASLARWTKAERVLLNYGSEIYQPAPGCSLRGQEKSELFYAVGDEVLKVTIWGAYVLGDRQALGSSVRCVKKKGSAAEMKQLGPRFGRRCPQLPWAAITQARQGCPPM